MTTYTYPHHYYILYNGGGLSPQSDQKHSSADV